MARTLYLDCNATTPLDPEVRAAMLPFLGEAFGNPSSIHQVGRAARAMLDDARARVAAVWECQPSEVIFTSGATEANNLAICGAVRSRRNRGSHVLTTLTEHAAVLQPLAFLARHEGIQVDYLPVSPEGRVDPADLRRALRPDTILVSVMAANNEIGTLQPVAELGAVCAERGVLFHTDAVQWLGKRPLDRVTDLHADLVAGCAHKLYGPKGVGVLYVRSGIRINPLITGGSHEGERRAGTENLPGIAGLAAAFDRFVRNPVFRNEYLDPLLVELEQGLRSLPGVTLRTPAEGRLCNTLGLTVEGCDSLTLLAALDLEGVCASSGSACSAGSLKPSRVLQALGVAADDASSFVRFSLGRDTTAEDIARVIALMPGLIHRARG